MIILPNPDKQTAIKIIQSFSVFTVSSLDSKTDSIKKKLSIKVL